MDNIDFEIIRLLMENSRLPSKQIAKSIGISINTVNRRIAKIVDEGVINYNLIIDATKFGFDIIYLLLHVKSEMSVIEDRLGVIGKIGMCMKCIGDLYIITLLVHRINNLERVIDMLLENLASIRIMVVRHAEPIRLSVNKLRIIKYLANKPRATNREISDMLGISSKTVKRSIDYLLNNGIIKFSLILNPAKLKGYINFSIVIIDDDINKMMYMLIPYLEKNFLIPPISVFHPSNSS